MDFTSSIASAQEVVPFPHELHFDPTFGYSFDDLLRVEPPSMPSDFGAFWQELFTRAMKLSPAIERKRSEFSFPGYTVEEVHYTSMGNVRVGAWMILPEDRDSIQRAAVIGHGYGGRSEPELPLGFKKGTALILPCARGLPTLSADAIDDIDTVPHHVLYGIESKDRYIHGACVADYMVAASILLELFPQTAQELWYLGGSFGGGIGALLLGADPRFSAGILREPSFGNHPLRVALKSGGSNSHVRRAWQETPDILDVLAYFDAASAARSIRVPTLFFPSLFDPAVPPPGQFSVINAVDPKLCHCHPMPAGHFIPPGGHDKGEEMAQVSKEFIECFSKCAHPGS